MSEPMPFLDDLIANNAPQIPDYPKTVFITLAHGEEFPVHEWRAEDLGIGWLFRHDGRWWSASKRPSVEDGNVAVAAQPERLVIESGDGVVARRDGDITPLSIPADTLVQVWPV